MDKNITLQVTFIRAYLHIYPLRNTQRHCTMCALCHDTKVLVIQLFSVAKEEVAPNFLISIMATVLYAALKVTQK